MKEEENISKKIDLRKKKREKQLFKKQKQLSTVDHAIGMLLKEFE